MTSYTRMRSRCSGAAFLKPIFRFRLIYDMHSSLPQQLNNFQFTKSRVLKATFRALEDTCLRKADAVITICPDLKNYALAAPASITAKHLLIENSIFDDVRLGTSARQSPPQRLQPSRHSPIDTI